MFRIIFLFVLLPLFIFNGCTKYVRKVHNIPSETKKITKTRDTKEQQKHFLKRKVAIARFSNETNYGKGFFYDGKNDRIAKQANDILSAKLAETGKFILLERSDINEIKSELNLSDLEKLSITADYLIVGSVSEFGRKTTSDVGVFSRAKKQTASAKVNIRLIKVATGQVIYSEEGAGEASSEDETVMGVGSRSGYNSTINDQAISTAISKLVSNIVSNLMKQPWKSYILDYNNDNYIISGGKTQGIIIGDIFAVYKRGKSVKNPQTGIMIELPGKQIGKIKVLALAGDSPENEISICNSIYGNIPKENFLSLYIQEIK
jgi:curli biogenesis system outer membrane secretion channel CsgG